VEGRDEADRGASNQPMTQVNKLLRAYAAYHSLLLRFDETLLLGCFMKLANIARFLFQHI